MSTIKLLELRDLPIDDLQPLVEESREEGFEFLDRLVTEYRDGTNIFQKKGEALFALYHQQKMIAVGGINRDPYLPNKKDTARVRHLYVLAFWRKKGIGKRIIQNIINKARENFQLLTLRTFNPEADAFYKTIGFKTEPKIAFATHHLILKEYKEL